ncbi:MAG: twin-arginine translocase TatA/TatE family subunit [Chloroflexi bacterium]|nr:twin-arginine translocase TatA/TatE family subunit [Chloroflexota bacterium]
MSLGPTELIIILIIVVLLFGVGRVSRIGGELGSAVANFRRGLDSGRKQEERSLNEGSEGEQVNAEAERETSDVNRR